MYQEFRVNTITTDIRNKTITIDFAFDIDTDSITDESIQLIHRETRNVMDYTYEIIDKSIVLTLMVWPEPNKEYVLKIEKLKNIVGDELVSGIRRKIIFESSLCSTIRIIYPAFNEVVNDTLIEWSETLADEEHEYVNSYFVEISKESHFYNIEQATLVEGRKTIQFPDLPIGQYFVRCRVQKDSQYGFWSETISFIVDKEPTKPEAIFDSEDEPLYIEDITVASVPGHGITPDSILIEFDCEIDSDFLENIVVIRKEF